MTIETQLQKYLGQTLDQRRYSIVLIPNGTYNFSTSDYIQTGVSDPVFYLVEHMVNGSLKTIITSHTDHIINSDRENTYGLVNFVQTRNFSFKSQLSSLEINLKHSYMTKPYSGLDMSLDGSNNLLIYKKNSSTTVDPPGSIIDDNKTILRPISWSGTTTTDTLTSTVNYIDLDNFTTSDPYSLIKSGGYAKITNGSLTETIFIFFYDTVSNTIEIKRGQLGTTARSWNGTFEVIIFNQTHPDNYDSISSDSDLVSGFKVYLVPHSQESYPRSFITMNRLYDPDSYNGTTVYSYDTGKQYYRFPYATDHFLFINNTYPAALVTDNVNNRVLKDRNQYTDVFYTNPYDADQGYIYDYCNRQETCGTCMGNTPDESDNCMVSATAYDVSDSREPLTYGKDYGSYDKNWNEKNKLQNHTVPIALCAGCGFFILLTFIVYLGLMGDFIDKAGKGKYMNHDFTEEKRHIHSAAVGFGVTSSLIVLATVGIIIASLIQGRKDSGDRFFPSVNYDRSTYNPPPGYTFINAPSSKN